MAGIYIHIPFCKTKCPYCDFYSFEKTDDFEPYIAALERETELRDSYIQGPVKTIYLGGGTPSLLSVQQVLRLLNKIDQVFGIDKTAEVTMECNPDDLSREYIYELKNTGVNRISLGTQSFNDDELEFLGRRHRSRKNFDALEYVFSEGFSNVSIDLIYGLPGSNQEKLLKSIGEVMQYPVPHVSAYHLTIERNTRFYKLFLKGIIKEISDEKSMNLFKFLVDQLEENGLQQYEISNFSRPGWHSVHNSNYWTGKPYLGLGASAHSFDGKSRSWNITDSIKYVDAIQNGTVPAEVEKLTENDRFNEYIMTRLRTMWGLDRKELDKRFDDVKREYFEKAVQKHIQAGDMELSDNYYVLTRKGKFLSDYIVRDLILVDE